MSVISLKEKLSSQLTAAPPKALLDGALFQDEERWRAFLAEAEREPEALFLRIAGELAWRSRPGGVGAVIAEPDAPRGWSPRVAHQTGGWRRARSRRCREPCWSSGGPWRMCARAWRPWSRRSRW